MDRKRSIVATEVRRGRWIPARRWVPVARRNILADRRRLAVAVLGVGVSLALILLLQGLWSGFRTQISAYEDNVGADLFVGEPGSRNFLGVPSIVSSDAVTLIRGLPGVDAADPIAVRFAVLDLHGRKQFVFLVGSVPGRMGGPWEIAQGRDVLRDGEVVIDRSLADQHGIDPGTRIQVMGERFTVVGLSAGTRSWMTGFLFTTHGSVERLVRMPSTTSFVLVRTDAPASVAASIRARTGLTVLTPDDLGDNDRALLGRVMNGPVVLMLLIAFAAGTLIIALTVYSAIVERIKEYGIAKAMGAGRSRLFAIVLGQTAAIALIGIMLGLLLFRGSAWLVTTLRPQMWVRPTVSGVAGALLAAALMSLVAAVVPTRRVLRLDPASVYRG